MSELKRVFIAVNLSEELRKEIFEEFVKTFEEEKSKIVKKDNLHLTLKFLGYLGTEKLQKIKEQMEKLNGIKKFKTKLSGIGEFNSRVIWLGVKEGSDKLIEISKKLDESIGLEEDKRFHPHVTLARNKDYSRKEIDENIKKLNKKNWEKEFIVESIDLMESVLSKEGSKYSALEKVRLSD